MLIKTVYHFLSLRWANIKEMDNTSEKPLLVENRHIPQESNLAVFIRL